MEKKTIYWVGKYESDIQLGFFAGSITYYGTGKNNNVSFCTQDIRIDSGNTEDFVDFVFQKMKCIISKDNCVKFMFYNPNWAYKIINLYPGIEEYVICLNNKTIVDLLNNKVKSKLWISNICDTPAFKLASRNECRYENLINSFPNYNEFIIQENISSGGKGTYVLNKNNDTDVISELSNTLLLVSPRIKNSYPVNIHLLISEDNILLFPSSIQIMVENNNNLLYLGADYIQAKLIPENIQKVIRNISTKIGQAIKCLGYKGVLGIDFLVENNSKVFFIEINPRFQGSTILLNKALIDKSAFSIYELNEKAFTTGLDNSTIKKCEEVDVKYSFVFYKKISNSDYYDHMFERMSKNEHYEILSDGYKNTSFSNHNSYLYRCLIDRNITYINVDNELNIVESLFERENFKLPIENSNHLINLKIALIVQGVIIEEGAIAYIRERYEIKDATFNAVDITIFNGLKINAPINISFVEISPFNIKYTALNKLELYYNDKFISQVAIDIEDQLPSKTTLNQIPYKSIAFRTNDRVRIRHSSICSFKENNLSCAFCESKHNNYINVPLDDIYEVIDTYEEQISFRHYLIGGASGVVNKEHERIIKIASYIKTKSGKPIYLMCLPPTDKNIIKEYYEAGITEVAFNLEVYNRQTAKEIMPGKGNIEMQQYIEAFKESVKYFGKNGNVRSMFILGLEKEKSLFEGIEFLASIGVSPMLSALRPMPKTVFCNSITYSVQKISALHKKAREICNRYNVNLGPICTKCQNNVIVLADEYYDMF